MSHVLYPTTFSFRCNLALDNLALDNLALDNLALDNLALDVT